MQLAQVSNKAWTEQMLLSLFFLVGGLAIFMFGNNWTSLFPTNRSALFKWGLAALFLGVALLLRRSEPTQKFWPVAFALFVAASANALMWGLGDWLARLLPPINDPALALAIDKLSQAIPVTLTILLLSWLVGDDLASLFIRGGNLAQSLRFGLISFGVWAALFAVIAVLQANSTSSTGLFAGGVPLSQVVAALPWFLIFVFANAWMEELWLRGLFLKKLQPLLGTTATVLVTTLVFALVHIGAEYAAPAERILFTVVVFAVGLVNAWVMLKTESIWGSVLFHAGYDLMVIIPILVSV